MDEWRDFLRDHIFFVGCGAFVTVVGAAGILTAWAKGAFRFLNRQPMQPTLSKPITQEHSLAKPSAKAPKDIIRDWLFERMGETARYDFFEKAIKGLDPWNGLYRDVIETMEADNTWRDIALGAKEWVILGHETLCNRFGNWGGKGTMNRLYYAFTDLCLKGEIPIKDAFKFGKEVKRLVAEKRASGV